MASRHNVEVRIEPIQRPGPDGYSLGRLVVLADDLYPPRRNFVFCHELAHILLGHSERTTKRAKDELEADRLAVELMLPEREFIAKMAKESFPVVKAGYPYASWEVVARRWSQFRPAVLTIADNGKIKARTAPESLKYPYHPSPAELDLIRKTIERRADLCSTVPPLTMNSFFIDEGRGVERVILLTEVSENFD